MRPRKLHVAGALIITAWLASLGWLVRREYFGRTPGELSASARVSPGAVFFAVYLNGEQIGTAATTIDTMTGGVRISERADVLLPDGGAGRRIRLATDLRLAPSLSLTSFESSVGGDAPQVIMRARAAGTDSLTLSLAWPGRPVTTRTVAPGALPAAAVPLRAVVDAPLEAGRRIDVAILDPLSGAVRRTGFLVGPPVQFVVPDSARLDSNRRLWVPAHMDTVTAWSLEEEASPIGARMWIDQQGFIVRAETPQGWTILRTAFEISQLNLRAGRPHRIPTPRLSYRALQLLRPGGVEPADTAPALLIPSDAPAIDSLARRLAPDSLPAEARARALFDFVARRIAVDAGGPPDAETALRSRRGSAAARALLLAALARSAAIPARTVSGARFADGAWRSDSWVMLYVGGWIGVDPARRAWPADSLRYPARLDGAAHPLEVLAPAARLLRPRTPATSD